MAWTNFEKRWELFDIEADRTEQHDLSGKHPEKVKELARLWSAWAAENFVEPEKVPQPAKGMPKIYYLPEAN